jgi:hypothetical protein
MYLKISTCFVLVHEAPMTDMDPDARPADVSVIIICLVDMFSLASNLRALKK